ncbi:sulfotransferase [Nodosilinea sp. LEGE 07088]|uniref:sulfotransferase family protein n=1 Tax=Nodosilinea sp. LEGE 07088 TaxID=2777968 RepID=UPI001882C2C3|nr:sulfotransferase [Nodosilinea sp. LEGE 07088]MBE9136011.1 sulfotransferase [Nodosilinea sp. LEGE 07088]
MIQPSFFIVGAPKCGTTALCKYLNRHPDIFIPEFKELHYFDTDLNTKKQANSLPDYLALFEAGAEKVCGEGSPTYLYSKTAAEEIYAFNPQAKIIIMLREPVAMMYAFHSQHLYNGSSETVPDFATALALEPERKLGQHIPPRCTEPQILFYREFAKFSDQVERYLQRFGRHQVKIVLFDDFKSHTEKVFRETLEFLSVAPDFETDLQPINSNKKVRNTRLQSLIKYPPNRMLELGKYLLPIPQTWRRTILENTKSYLKQINTQKATRSPLDAPLKAQLIEDFTPELQRLELLIDRDLSHWYRPDQTP